jgi:hypothetical protein
MGTDCPSVSLEYQNTEQRRQTRAVCRLRTLLWNIVWLLTDFVVPLYQQRQLLGADSEKNAEKKSQNESLCV